MKRVSRLVSLSVLLALPAIAHAQSCSAVPAYAPPNPVLGQPVTVTLTAQSFVQPTSANSTEYIFYYQADEANLPTITNGYGYTTQISNTPDVVPFTFTPYAVGQVSVFVGLNSVYAYGETPICGQTLNPAPITFEVVPVGPPGLNGNLLHGQYAFLLQGTTPRVQGAANDFAAVGSFMADGQGNITAGIEDSNSGAGSNIGVPITGTYSIDAGGQGILNLKSAARNE